MIALNLVDRLIDRLRKILKFWYNIPWRIRNPTKKPVHNSEFGWGRYDQNKPRCSVFEPAPTNSNWTEVLGETSLPSFSMMWTTKELAMIALQNELHTPTTLDRRWTYTRFKNRSSLKGGSWRCHTKRLGACDILKINASVKGKNWGSTSGSWD